MSLGGAGLGVPRNVSECLVEIKMNLTLSQKHAPYSGLAGLTESRKLQPSTTKQAFTEKHRKGLFNEAKLDIKASDTGRTISKI